MVYFLLALSIVASVTYALSYYKISIVQAIIFKSFCSLCFVTLGIVSSILNKNLEFNSYTILIIVGLCFGLFGDVFLAVKRLKESFKLKFFLLGITCFSLGHISYIIALSYVATLDIYWYFIMIIVLSALGIGFMYKMDLQMGKAKVANCIYTVITSIILTIAILNVFDSFIKTRIIIAIAIILFSTSDLILSVLYFGKKLKNEKLAKRLNLFTYYFGQILIAFSLFLI